MKFSRKLRFTFTKVKEDVQSIVHEVDPKIVFSLSFRMIGLKYEYIKVI